MRIGELARATGCRVETIRYYERERLLPAPPRTAAGYRCYGRQHLEQLRFILHCRSLDMPLADIRLLQRVRGHPDEACDLVNEMVERRIGEVQMRIAGLHELRRQLEALRATCRSGRVVEECGIIKTLDTAAAGEGCACHGGMETDPGGA